MTQHLDRKYIAKLSIDSNFVDKAMRTVVMPLLQLCRRKRFLISPSHHHGKSTAWVAGVVAIASVLQLLNVTAMAQAPDSPARTVEEAVEETVQLNFPSEIEVKTLADFVSDRLRISIFYDESVRGKRITVRSPQPIPVSSLLSVLQSTLQMKGLVLVEAGTPGWYRIVSTTRLTDVARVGQAIQEGDAVPITATFALKHADPQRLDQVVKQFLTQPGANSIPVKEENLLIVTDYATNLTRVQDLIKTLDRPEPPVVTDFYRATNLSAEEIVQTVNPILTAGASTGDQARPVQLLPDSRTNQVAIIGLESDVIRASKLLERFDVALGLQTSVYQFQGISAERFDKLFQELIDPLERKTHYHSTVDADANLLVVRATVGLQERVAQLKKELDAPREMARSRVRLMKLKYANVGEVLPMLQSIGQTGALSAGESATPGMDVNSAAGAPTGSTNPMLGVIQIPPQVFPLPFPVDNNDGFPANLNPRIWNGGGASLPGGVQVSADPVTNSLILVGEPSAQDPYLDLIAKLDVPRPQVMIEAHIVAIDTSDNFSLGVELSFGDRKGLKRIFQFTSFGLSEVDPITGALKIIPNIGFNGTLVDPNVADAVVQALASHARAKVLASPKILVNDNTRGRFENVLSVPFESVNASQTVSTTSLGGSQQAGTTIDVTPHIKEGGEMELEFNVEFSAFSGSSSNAALPPPRQISRAESIVTIPDGHTVIVGGLKQIGTAESQTGVPYLELSPIIRALTSLQSTETITTSFFLFIKPVIVRDDQFTTLKYLSGKDFEHAGFPGRFPLSKPLLFRCDESCPPPGTTDE